MDCHELPMRLCHCDHVRVPTFTSISLNYDIESRFLGYPPLKKLFHFVSFGPSRMILTIFSSFPSSSDHRFFSENLFASFSLLLFSLVNCIKQTKHYNNKKNPWHSRQFIVQPFVKDYEEAIKCTWRFCPTFHQRKKFFWGRKKGKKKFFAYQKRQKSTHFPIWNVLLVSWREWFSWWRCG